MKKQNYQEYLRVRREGRYLVEHAILLAKHCSYYDSSHDMNFLEAVVRVLGSEKDYEKFSTYRMGSDSRNDQTVIASR